LKQTAAGGMAEAKGMTAPAEVILTDDRGRGPLGHPRTPYIRFEDEDGVITLHPIPTDVTRAEALMWKRNPREAARIASSLNAATADSGVATELTDDEL
jgi:hypothetical protein